MKLREKHKNIKQNIDIFRQIPHPCLPSPSKTFRQYIIMSDSTPIPREPRRSLLLLFLSFILTHGYLIFKTSLMRHSSNLKSIENVKSIAAAINPSTFSLRFGESFCSYLIYSYDLNHMIRLLRLPIRKENLVTAPPPLNLSQMVIIYYFSLLFIFI